MKQKQKKTKEQKKAIVPNEKQKWLYKNVGGKE